MNIAITTQTEEPGTKTVLAISEFGKELLAAMPRLRRLALSLVGRSDRVDDLVQETLMKSLSHRTSFRAGTNLQAWLATILINEFYTYKRRARREVEDPDGRYARNAVVLPDQHGYLDLVALNAALARLPVNQQKALSLVVVSGLPYAEAARACRVKTGTIKSRIKRARTRLAELMGTDGLYEFGPDAAVQAAVAQLHLH
jgi:RNA polymerase sigma-70 factor (ECF subfamily)